MPVGTERFLVTGAAGCIGAWAVRLLLDEGVPVVAADLSTDLRRFDLISHGRGGRPEFAQLDVTSTREVADVVADYAITHVVHLAGLQLPFCAADPPPGAMVNVVGTVNVFEAVRAAGRPIGLALASSAAVFGPRAGTPPVWSRTAPRCSRTPSTACTRRPTRAPPGLRDRARDRLGRPPAVHRLRPRPRPGHDLRPNQGHVAAAAGVPFRIKFSGSILLTPRTAPGRSSPQPAPRRGRARRSASTSRGTGSVSPRWPGSSGTFSRAPGG